MHTASMPCSELPVVATASHCTLGAVCPYPWEGAPSAETVARAETQGPSPGLFQGCRVIRHLLGSTELIRPYLPGSVLVRSSTGVLRWRCLPLKQTKRGGISKVQVRKEKVLVCHSCKHVSRLGDSGNTGKRGEKSVLSSQSALNEVSRLSPCQVKE